ncbi:MAG: hypothetical protein ACOX6I_00230 [Syntrophomonadaceae bacterium]|jgi:cell division protein FtsL
MSQSHYSYSVNWKEMSLEPETNTRRVIKTYKKINTKRRFVIQAGIFLFVYGLVLVYLCMTSAALGYQILALEKNIHQIETSNKQIEYQISEKSSLQRIERMAAKELGMYKPAADTGIAIAVQPEAVPVAPGQKDSPAQTGVAEKPMDKVYSAIKILAQRDNH